MRLRLKSSWDFPPYNIHVIQSHKRLSMVLESGDDAREDYSLITSRR
jgi:hypothetical protein